MSKKGIENPENIKYYSTIDGKKSLTWDQIFSDFLQYLRRDGEDLEKYGNNEKLLQVATRMFLIKKGYLGPGQQPGEGIAKELYEKIIQNFGEISVKEDWRIQSALRQQLREEKGAGQTYKESDLE